jgi:uncharacterized protein YbjT (DUF2867 family)
MSAQEILVIRSTGTQGTAVVRHLLQKGYKVRAFVRDASEDRALLLKSLGAILFEGSLDDPNVITRAATGCSGLFFTLMPSFADDSESRQAKSILSAAVAAGVNHVVYSSTLNVGHHEKSYWDSNNTAAPAMLGKYETEELLRHAGIRTWTILRPGYFMTNFFAPAGPFMFPGLADRLEFESSYFPDTTLALVDPNDIGLFAAAAFSDPAKFNKHHLDIVGDPMTVEQVVPLLEKAVGAAMKLIYRSEDETEALAATNPLIAGQILSRTLNKGIDLEGAKRWGIPLGTFKGFLEKNHALVEETFSTAK